MEKLLNKLLEKGWKPFESETQKAREWVYCKKYFFFEWCADWKSIRELVSKESWLWQFVCENKLVKTKDKEFRYRYEDLEKTQNYFSWYWYEYRIIESALKDESDLEKFLLDNIKV